MVPTDRLRVATVVLALLVAAPSAALAQRDTFADALVEFHSALFGTYGDEGPAVMSALDRMAASLDEWERTNARWEAELRARPAASAAEWALLHTGSQQLERAIDSTRQAIAAEPPRASLHVFLGRLYDTIGRRADAAAAFEAARRLDPADPIAAYFSALHAAERHDPDAGGDTAAGMQPRVATMMAAYDDARRAERPRIPEFALVRDLSAKTRVFAPAAYDRGFALIRDARFRDAIASFRDTAAGDPLVNDPATRTGRGLRGIAALRERRGTEALEHLAAAVREHPSSSEAHRVLGVVYRALGRLDESIAAFEKAASLAPSDERAVVALGSALTDAGRLEEAARVLDAALARLPRSGEARWALSLVFERLDRPVDALRVLDDAASLIVVAGKAHLYWRIAELAHAYHRDHARVTAVLAERVYLAPNEPHVHKDLGMAYSRAGRDDEALLALLMAAVLGHEDAETLTAIGQIHLTQDRLDRALAALERAVALDPASSTSRYVLARTLQRLGRTADADEQLRVFDTLRAEAFAKQRHEYERDAATAGAAPK
jgi:tetratricopeptide (TPR) repeat protein